MRVLFAHNYYQQSGGEDAVVANEQRILSQHAHDVRLFSVSNDDIAGTWMKLKTAWQTPYAPAGRERLRDQIVDFRPEIVHVHNFFPLLTPAIYDACREARVPVVQTLHNYRTICAGSQLMRNGRPCEDCVGASPYKAVLHKCYRDSRLGSFAVARMIGVHNRKDTWRKKVDQFIALTEFARSRFVDGGLPAEKISVKPNFVADPETSGKGDGSNREGALFVGRLSAEKGVGTLLQAWKSIDVSLAIAGDGPLAEPLRETVTGMSSARWLGRLSPENVTEAMRSAELLIMPSEWYEGFPMVLVEAFSCGLPVIASRLGGMAEIIEDGVTGLHFTPGDAEDLTNKVRWAAAHPKEMRAMGRQARQTYEQKYTPDVNYTQLMAIYEAACQKT